MTKGVDNRPSPADTIYVFMHRVLLFNALGLVFVAPLADAVCLGCPCNVPRPIGAAVAQTAGLTPCVADDCAKPGGGWLPKRCDPAADCSDCYCCPRGPIVPLTVSADSSGSGSSRDVAPIAVILAVEPSDSAFQTLRFSCSFSGDLPSPDGVRTGSRPLLI